MGLIGDFFKSYHENGILPNIWKGATGQLSQEKINDENIAYQRERNQIEDARYKDETAYNRAFAENQRSYERSRDALSDERYLEETAYNRAFAENERDYQRGFAAEEQSYNRRFAEEQRDYERALQQQIFEREDTAIERQAQSLAKLGINPLSQSMSGLGAGSVVSSGTAPHSSAGSASAPAAGNQSHSSGQQAPALSSRGGKALQKMMINAQGINQVIGPIMSAIQSIDALQGNSIYRDVLRAQRDFNDMQNLVYADRYGITDSYSYWKDGELHTVIPKERKESKWHLKSPRVTPENQREDAEAERSVRVNTDQRYNGTNDFSSAWLREMTDKSNHKSFAAGDSLLDISEDGVKGLINGFIDLLMKSLLSGVKK